MASPSKAHWESKRSEVRERYGLDALWSSFHPAKDGAPAHLSIDFMIVHPDNRGQGRGAAAAREILAWADANDVIVTLTPQPEPGYKKKLTDWYKGMGFVMNKGRSRNFDYRDTMIRYPRPREGNPGDIDACALGKWAWDRDPKACGDDPPSPSDAAKRLAKKRWTARERWVAARLLRGES